jgi:REP element-mobilizing transposase RayT
MDGKAQANGGGSESASATGKPTTRKRHDYLRRLEPGFYRGHAFVHWIMTVDGRATGWLTPIVHATVREVLLHTLSRYRLLCPIYCLMPDHVHLLWAGLAEDSDQQLAASLFRRHAGIAFQKQGFDHVLHDRERDRDQVAQFGYYIAENPVRAGLVAAAPDWSFSGSMAAGYPDFDWRDARFVEKLWKIYTLECAKNCGGSGSASATP